MESRPKVRYVPPPDDALRDLARRICERTGHPEHAYDMGSFLILIARMQANAKNKEAEQAEQAAASQKEPEEQQKPAEPEKRTPLHGSAPVSISASKAHLNFSDLIRRASSGEEHFIVEKRGFPAVAIISKADYDDLMRERTQRKRGKQARLRRFRESARALGEEIEKRGLSEEEALAELEETRQRLFTARRDRKTPPRRT